MTLLTGRISSTAVLLVFSLGLVAAQNHSDRSLFLKSRPSVNNGEQSLTHSSETVALGYSLFLRNTKNKAVRTNPSRVFREGDAIRILVECNADGHLYIFNQEGNGSLRMIYPDLLIRSGTTQIMAHVPVQLPSKRDDSVGDTDWFELTGPPQRELLFLVFSLKPVSSWPAGKELMAYPGGFTLRWEEFRRTARSVARSIDGQTGQDEGEPMTIGEQASLSRGLKLVRQDPGPSVVRINQNKVDPFAIEIEMLRR